MGYAERDAILIELAKLPRRQRAVLVLRLVAGMATVALAAGLTAALVPGGGPGPQTPAAVQIPGQGWSTVQPPITSRHGLPAAAKVGQAMATAFGGVADDILYTTETGRTNGYVPSILQGWSWPAQPVLGQKEYVRSYLVQRTSRSKPLLPAEDNGFVYDAPPASANYVNARLTMVCCYLPLKMITGVGSSQPSVATWSFLSPSPAHLALLRPRIPAGFPHSPGSWS